MRAIGASEKMPSVSAGRISCLRLAMNSSPVAGEQAVDQVEAGDVRRRAEEDVEPAERRRRPAEQVVEDVDQDQAGEEHRQRHAGGRDHAAGVIDERARPRGGEDPERHRDRHRHDQPEQRELGRGRQPGADLGRHRLAGGERIAEVAAREVAARSARTARAAAGRARASRGSARSPPWWRRARRNRRPDRRAAPASAGR